ncbi:hypothetical protein ABBQ32_011320 [Trebouxia sp. C0010 RCD-2024]
MPDSQPAWMALSRGHRQHWSQRQQQQQAQQQQQPPEQPRQRHSNRATIGEMSIPFRQAAVKDARRT